MFAELIEWVMSLDPEFAFLLALPFAVALAGFVAEAFRTGRQRTHAPRARDNDVVHIGRPWTSGA
jgi:hypothetical protein